MTKNLQQVAVFVRTGFVAVVGISFIAPSVFAQAPASSPAGGTAEAERVIVTGSLIPTTEEVTANPVDVVSQQEIRASGQTVDILNVLTKRDPDFVGAGNLGQSNASIASGATQGGTIISIRGLPTLTLIDDRRFALSAAISTGGFVFQDVSVIPTRLIGRIEVLKDGASAIYGSDAVGGVVNVHMNDDFTGLDIGYRYGTRLGSGVSERQGWALAGTGNDTTHIIAGFQYYEIDPLFTREEDFGISPGLTTTFGGVGRDSTPSLAGQHFYLIDSLVPANWPAGSSINSPLDNVGVRSIAPSTLADNHSNGYEQLSALGVYRPSSFGEVVSYNLTLKTTDTLDQSVTHAYTSFVQKICGDQLEAFGSFLFTHNKSESFLNAQPLSNSTGVVIPSAMNFAGTDAMGNALYTPNLGLQAPYTPFQESIDGSTTAGAGRLTVANRYQSHPLIFTNDNDFYRLLGGLRSQITDADHGNWYAEGTANYSHYQTTFVNQNLVRADVLNQLIVNQDAAGNAIPGQTLDFFALDPIHDGARSIAPDVFNTIFGNNIREQTSYLRSFDAQVRGDVFELPGGPISVAAGVEYRIEGFKDTDSPEIFIGSVPVGQIDVGRNIFSAFSELRIPFVGPQMNVPWVYSLELTLQGRYETIEGISGDSKVPKVMLRYQPIKDLTLRGTYGNSFVAPDLFSLFGPQARGFSPSVSFTNEQAQVLTGSNPDLQPATAQSWTAGAIYSPSWLLGFTLTADYFWTLEQNIIGVLGASTILSSVNALGPASPYANLVGFNNFPGHPGSQPVTAAGQLFNLASVYYIDTARNIGADRVEGWDLDASYNFDLQNVIGIDAGNILLDARAVVFMGHDQKTNAQTPYYNILGFVGDESFGAFPDYKLTFLVQHSWRGFTVSLNINYIPEMQDELGGDLQFDHQSDATIFPVVDDYITVDGRLSYTFSFPAPDGTAQAPAMKDGKAVADKKAVVPGMFSPSCWSYQTWLNNLTLTVGCNNMTDEDPSIVRGANSSTNLQVYDPYGRFVYFEVDKKF